MENILKNIGMSSYEQDQDDKDNFVDEQNILNKAYEKLLTHFVIIYSNIMKSRENSVIFYSHYSSSVEILKEIMFDFAQSENALSKQISLLLLVVDYENKENPTNKVVTIDFLKELAMKIDLNHKLPRDGIERCIQLIENPNQDKSRKSIVLVRKINYYI